MGIKLKNNAVSLITTPISASDVGLAVTTGDGSKFPALGFSDYFYATLTSSAGTSEIVKVTARVGDTMTIVRAQEGTSAQSFPVNSRIEARVTAQSVLDVARYSEAVSVKDFGALGDGATDDLTAFHAAMAAAKYVYVPPGVYYLSAKLQIQQSGQRLIGSTAQGGSLLYPTHRGGRTIENNAYSDVEVANFWIYVRDSTNGANDGVGFYQAGGPWLYLHDCTIYNPDAAGGTGIVLDDRNNAGIFQAGAYQHTIERINMARGNYLATGIKTAGTTGGINASRIHDCHIFSDNCIEWNAGGGNFISGNLLQSATGTQSIRAGRGFNNVSGGSAMLSGNYMERFEYDVFSGSTAGPELASIISSHHSDLSASVTGYGGGASSLPFVVDQNGIWNLSGYISPQTISADSAVISTSASFTSIAGNGVARLGCTLTTDVARNGALIYIFGESWPVQIVEGTTADFGPYKSSDGMIFGTAGASISIGGITRPTFRSAIFYFNSSLGKWVLLSATPYRSITGNVESADINADAATVPTNANVVNITGNGAARSNCVLQAPVIDGQQVTILGRSWAVTVIPSTTAVFDGAAASVTFGDTTGQIMAMVLTGFNGKWYETSRSIT